MNPMAMALKSRRSESAKPAMSDQIQGPPAGDGAAEGQDKLQQIVAMLSPEDKSRLMEMLSSEQEQAPEGEAENTAALEDDAGQSKVSAGELAELKGEAANMFSGQGGALGEEEPEDGPAPRGLADRFKASIAKKFNK